jgi:hypothetical protein
LIALGTEITVVTAFPFWTNGGAFDDYIQFRENFACGLILPENGDVAEQAPASGHGGLQEEYLQVRVIAGVPLAAGWI